MPMEQETSTKGTEGQPVVCSLSALCALRGRLGQASCIMHCSVLALPDAQAEWGMGRDTTGPDRHIT
jgi:hypothetical protein